MDNKEIPGPLFTLRGDMKAVHCILFQLSGGIEYLYTATQTGLVHKWNLKSCREEFQIEVSKENEACLAVKHIEQLFISQTKGGKIKVWEEDKESWRLKTELTLDYWGFCKFDTFGNKYLVCPESGSKVIIYSLDGKIVNTLYTTSDNKCGEIMALKSFTLSGTEYIFVLYESGELKLFEASGRVVSAIKVGSDCPMALDFDGESKGVVGTSGDVIVGFQLTSELRLEKWKESSMLTNPGVSSIKIRPDKKLVAAGCWDSRIRLFTMKSLRLLVVLASHRDTIQDICYSPARVDSLNSSWLLAAAGKDGRVTLWNLY